MESKKKTRMILPALLMAVLMLCMLSGCGKESEEGESTTISDPSGTRPQITSFSDLEDKRIGVTTGSVQALQAEERFPNDRGSGL